MTNEPILVHVTHALTHADIERMLREAGYDDDSAWRTRPIRWRFGGEVRDPRPVQGTRISADDVRTGTMHHDAEEDYSDIDGTTIAEIIEKWKGRGHAD